MPAGADRSHVRLAELVAALSMGIDLGFAQPMEHVLRQCLIALRIAERLEMTDEERGAIYYSALLVNVGCHADAHEQAKWFGDDIGLKANKFASYDMRSLRSTAATMGRLGAGNQPLHRLRVALEFAVSGHREVDGMVSTHNAFARLFTEQLGLPEAVGEAVATAYERWDGRGWPGSSPASRSRSRRGWRSSPSTSRSCSVWAGLRPRARSPATVPASSSIRRSRRSSFVRPMRFSTLWIRSGTGRR